MTEKDSGLTRKEFLRFAGGAAGVMATSAAYGVSEAVIDFERAKLAATDILEKRHKKKTRFIFGDHIPKTEHTGIQNGLLVGEIVEWRLRVSPDEDYEHLPEDSRWIGGYEVGGQKRHQAFDNVVKTTKLLASTDGQLHIPDEYLPVMEDESIKRVFAVISVLLGGATASQFVLKKLAEKNVADDLQSRRKFLFHSLMSMLLGFVSYRTGMDLLHHNRGIADLSELPEEWREIFFAIPYMDSAVPLRNKIMATNINALGSFSFEEYVQNLTIFAGLGHIKLPHEFLKEPEKLEQQLTDIMDTQLDSLFDLYAKNNGSRNKQDFITGYIARGLGKLYFPVFIRLNEMLEKCAEEIGVAEAIRQSIAITDALCRFSELTTYSNTAALLFIQRLDEFSRGNHHHQLKLVFSHDISQALMSDWNIRQVRGVRSSHNFAFLLPKIQEIPRGNITIGNTEFIHQLGFVNGFRNNEIHSIDPN